MSGLTPLGFRRSLPERGKKTGAFTLIELLVVFAIIGVLITLTLPSVQSVAEGSEMSRAGEIMSGQIREARQHASAFNMTVQMRLIKTTGSSGKGYNALQAWGPANTAGVASPIDRITYLPQTVVIADSTQLSQFLSLLPAAQSMTIPGVTTTASYVAFKIRSSGLVEPVPALTQRGLLYLTLVAIRSAEATTPPSNYFIVQLNPDTGIALTYRP